MPVPMSVPSGNMPNGQEFPLYVFDQLDIVDKPTLMKRAKALKAILKDPQFSSLVQKEFVDSLREHGDLALCIQWCAALLPLPRAPRPLETHFFSFFSRRLRRMLEAQCILLSVSGVKPTYTPQDFGAAAKTSESTEVFTGNLPSIKMSKETILARSPKKGPTMHDTPPKPTE